MIRILSADDELFIGFTQEVEVAVHQFQLSIVSLRARIREKSVVETLRCDFCKFAGELYRGLVRTSKEIVVEGQLLELCSDGVFDRIHAVA